MRSVSPLSQRRDAADGRTPVGRDVGIRPMGRESARARSAWASTRGRFRSTPVQRAALHAPIAEDVTSVMDIRLMLGAMGAAGLAGRFAPIWRVSARSALAATTRRRCCSGTARASRTAATLARFSAASRRAACTGGRGSSRRSSATSLARGFARDSGSTRRSEEFFRG